MHHLLTKEWKETDNKREEGIWARGMHELSAHNSNKIVYQN